MKFEMPLALAFSLIAVGLVGGEVVELLSGSHTTPDVDFSGKITLHPDVCCWTLLSGVVATLGAPIFFAMMAYYLFHPKKDTFFSSGVVGYAIGIGLAMVILSIVLIAVSIVIIFGALAYTFLIGVVLRQTPLSGFIDSGNLNKWVYCSLVGQFFFFLVKDILLSNGVVNGATRIVSVLREAKTPIAKIVALFVGVSLAVSFAHLLGIAIFAVYEFGRVGEIDFTASLATGIIAFAVTMLPSLGIAMLIRKPVQGMAEAGLRNVA